MPKYGYGAVPKSVDTALVIATGVFVVGSVVGFAWVNKVILERSFGFLAELDLATFSGLATAAGCAALLAAFLYYVNYPEGERAADAAKAFKKDL